MYDTKDPRSALASATPSAPKAPVTDYAAAEVIEFHKVPPSETGEGYKTWYGRGQNFILSYTEADAGVTLAREGQIDEYMAFFPQEHTRVDIETDKGSAKDVCYKLAIIPPGNSAITTTVGGWILRLFTTLSPDLAAKCYNSATYDKPHPNIPPFQPWPEPSAGFKLRLYPIAPPAEPGRFGVLYRSTNLMINLFPISTTPSDPNKVSPHHHDDFEQCSLTLHGDYMHHIRWPWTVNKAIWREDAHLRCSAPSMTVIPPPATHTSKAYRNRLAN